MLKVQLPKHYVLGIWVVGAVVQVLGLYIIVGFLDTQGALHVLGLGVTLGDPKNTKGL